MSDEGPRIEVTQNGNYRVRGRVPIYPGRILRSEDGSSIDWELDEPYPLRRTVTLCRCGRSGNKPFCDDTHQTIEWDGEETADRGPTSARRKAVPGQGVTLTDDVSLCTSAAFCHDRVTDVWRLTFHRSDEPEVRRRIEGIVARCPSGRLVLETHDGAEVEPEYEPSIVVQEGGPYWVRGRVPIMAVDGRTWEVRNRLALCRCGASGNKPFCDSTHLEIGFA
ncbi:MAG TPA: CDGSH iron-sulfur domain-containing protein [Actinomycetota bacterium]